MHFKKLSGQADSDHSHLRLDYLTKSMMENLYPEKVQPAKQKLLISQSQFNSRNEWQSNQFLTNPRQSLLIDSEDIVVKKEIDGSEKSDGSLSFKSKIWQPTPLTNIKAMVHQRMNRSQEEPKFLKTASVVILPIIDVNDSKVSRQAIGFLCSPRVDIGDHFFKLYQKTKAISNQAKKKPFKIKPLQSKLRPIKLPMAKDATTTNHPEIFLQNQGYKHFHTQNEPNPAERS